MAPNYTQNEPPLGLNVKTVIAPGDVHVMGDLASGQAQQATQTTLENTIANSANFIAQLLASGFPVDLANDAAFISALTSNALFQQLVNAFVMGGGSGGGASISQVFNASDFTNDGSGNGIATFSTRLPETAIPIGVIYEFITPFNGGTMEVLDSKAAGDVIGANVPANTSNTLIGATSAQPTKFNFAVTPFPIVFMPGFVPASGQVKVTIVYGAGSGGVISSNNANQTLAAGNTVGLAPFIGGVAFANRNNATVGSFPDTIENSGSIAQPYLTKWIGADSVFVLYKVNSSFTLKGIVGTINRATMVITWGTPVTYTTTLSIPNPGGSPPGVNPQFSLCMFDTNKVGVSYVQSGAATDVLLDISTISGSTITQSGGQALLTVPTLCGNLALGAINTTTGILFTASESGFGVKSGWKLTAFTISGTTLGTVGTSVAATISDCASFEIITSNIALGGFTLFSTHTAAVATAGTVTGTVVTIGTETGISSGGGQLETLSIVRISDGVLISSGNDTSQQNFKKLTIAGNVISVGSAYTPTSTAISGGIGLLDATHVIAYVYDGSNPNWYVLNISASVPTLQYIVTGVENEFYNNSFTILNSYFIVLQLPINGVSGSLFIEGMSGGFLGIAENVATTGQATSVLTKGEDSNQTSIIIGATYTPNGSGGIVLSSSGTMVGKNSSTIIL